MQGKHVAALSMAAGAVLILSGCQKPPPAITVWSGTTSVDQPALCWAFDSESLSPGECAEEIITGSVSTGVEQIEAEAGNTVGISVDTAVAESGWFLKIGGQTVNQEPLTGTYFRFTFPMGMPKNGMPMQVVAGNSGNVRGIWLVRLVPSGA
ncbi:MAG: hypothetical protein U0904_12040 [Candidatus Nanopelagicales bacterium]|nr:hypothetical protein [Candidatus Nanopelagicales bacterium]